MPKRKSKEIGGQEWREAGRSAEERRKRHEAETRLEKSGRGNRLVERALRERN